MLQLNAGSDLDCQIKPSAGLPWETVATVWLLLEAREAEGEHRGLGGGSQVFGHSEVICFPLSGHRAGRGSGRGGSTKCHRDALLLSHESPSWQRQMGSKRPRKPGELAAASPTASATGSTRPQCRIHRGYQHPGAPAMAKDGGLRCPPAEWQVLGQSR